MISRRLVLAGGAALFTLPLRAQGASRVLCLGGSLTETVFALGAASRLIGRDTTSTFPPEAEALPDVGYLRALSAEGVLAMAPDLILAEDDAGPVEVVEVLKKSGIRWVTVGDNHTPDAVVSKIMTVGAELGLDTSGLAAKAQAELDAARTKAASIADADRKRVLFVLSAQGGRIMAGGQTTSAEGIITLAGGTNAAQGFDGFKPMSDEAVLTANPDVVLMMDREGDHASSDDDLFALPALALSPAAANRAVIRMDGLYLLGFGPRTGQAALDLQAALYG
jgi:iron complex transport system substrate-binding protein